MLATFGARWMVTKPNVTLTLTQMAEVVQRSSTNNASQFFDRQCHVKYCMYNFKLGMYDSNILLSSKYNNWEQN